MAISDPLTGCPVFYLVNSFGIFETEKGRNGQMVPCKGVKGDREAGKAATS